MVRSTGATKQLRKYWGDIPAFCDTKQQMQQEAQSAVIALESSGIADAIVEKPTTSKKNAKGMPLKESKADSKAKAKKLLPPPKKS